MPGLAGVIRRERPLRSPRDILDSFRTVGLVNGVTYRYKSFDDRGAVILNTLTGLLPSTLDQPAVDPAGNVFLFLEGEVFNLDDIRDRFGGSADATPCELLLALYLRRGDEFIRLLNGEFNIVIFDTVTRRLDLFCDHIASMPMYYLEQAEGLFFGSEKKFILSVLKESPAVDPVGLLQIVAHRHNLDERTFLEGVGRMMPGAQLTYQRGRLRVRHRDLLECATGDRRARVDTLREEWAEHLQKATRRRVEGKENIFVSLSGGLDSRAIACALPRDLRPVSSRTRALGGSLEADIAAEIAARLDFEHVREDPFAVLHSNILPKVAWRTECETPFMNALSIANHVALRDRCKFITGGWLGGVSAGSQIGAGMLVPMSRGRFVERAFRRSTGAAWTQLPRLFSQSFLADTLPLLQEAFHASFRKFEGHGNIRAYEIWDLFQRQRRQTTSSMPVDSYLFEKIRPFYDKDYLDFTLTLPTRLRFGQVLYQSMICQLGPELRDLPNANTGFRLRPAVLGNLASKSVILAQRSATRRIRRFKPSYCNSIERRRAEDLGAAFRREGPFRLLIERFLESDDFDAGIFNRNGIRAMLGEHCHGVRDHSWLLGQMATFSAGLPWFLHRTVRCPQKAQPLEEGPAPRYGRPRRDDQVVVNAPEARPAPAR